jgi:hypothetical protein
MVEATKAMMNGPIARPAIAKNETRFEDTSCRRRGSVVGTETAEHQSGRNVQRDLRDVTAGK